MHSEVLQGNTSRNDYAHGPYIRLHICENTPHFVKEALTEHPRNGSISLWGYVDEVHVIAPYIVLPIEPTKPRMCVSQEVPQKTFHIRRFTYGFVK